MNEAERTLLEEIAGKIDYISDDFTDPQLRYLRSVILRMPRSSREFLIGKNAKNNGSGCRSTRAAAIQELSQDGTVERIMSLHRQSPEFLIEIIIDNMVERRGYFFDEYPSCKAFLNQKLLGPIRCLPFAAMTAKYRRTMLVISNVGDFRPYLKRSVRRKLQKMGIKTNEKLRVYRTTKDFRESAVLSQEDHDEIEAYLAYYLPRYAYMT